MTQAHGIVRLNTQVKSLRESRRPGIWIALIAVLLLGLFSSTAKAQFSGPALGESTPVNSPLTRTTDPAILYPTEQDFHLAQGDLVTVHIYGAGDYAPTVRIGLDGRIQLPLIGVVEVQGLTLRQAEDLIAERLTRAGMYRDPQVSIQVVEAPNQIVTVMGETHGVVPVIGQKRLYDVLSALGGLPLTASHTITINRPTVPEPIVIDLGTDPAKSALANIPIFPRDTIIVSRVGVVYLLGAFKTQGPVPLQTNAPLTLMQLAAIGGGPGWESNFGDLRIIRTIGFDRKVVHINLKKVMNGKDPDPVLLADDIVFLPTDPMKAAIKSGGIQTLIGIVSILVFAINN